MGKKHRRKSGHLANQPVEAPSPERIVELTAESRKGWSPRARAGRTGTGCRPVETMVISTLAFGDVYGSREH